MGHIMEATHQMPADTSILSNGDSVESRAISKKVVGSTDNVVGESGPHKGVEGCGPQIYMGQKEVKLLSFYKACYSLRSPRRKRSKVVSNLGRKVDHSKSYFHCIAPRSSSRNSIKEERQPPISHDGKGQRETSYGGKGQREGNQTFSGEYISSHSYTDSETMRCNRRIRNAESSDLGSRIWDSIAKLGVVEKDEVGMSAKLVEALERRDKEIMEGKKELKSCFI